MPMVASCHHYPLHHALGDVMCQSLIDGHMTITISGISSYSYACRPAYGMPMVDVLLCAALLWRISAS